MVYIIARQSQLRDIRSKIKNAPEGKRSQEIAYQLFKHYDLFDGLSGKATSLELGLADSYSSEVSKFIHLGRRIASETKPGGSEDQHKAATREMEKVTKEMKVATEEMEEMTKEMKEVTREMEKVTANRPGFITGIGRFIYKATVLVVCTSLALAALYVAYLAAILS